jgi:hypothetical protein
VIDTHNNSPLLNTVLDMLGVLMHGIVPTEGPIESNRICQTLVCKIRKDIGERRSDALDEVKRFLPLQNPSLDIYVVEPFDGVSNRISNPEMKKHRLQVARKVSRGDEGTMASHSSNGSFPGENQQLGDDRRNEISHFDLLLVVLFEENGT